MAVLPFIIGDILKNFLLEGIKKLALALDDTIDDMDQERRTQAIGLLKDLLKITR